MVIWIMSLSGTKYLCNEFGGLRRFPASSAVTEDGRPAFHDWTAILAGRCRSLLARTIQRYHLSLSLHCQVPLQR